MVSIIIPTYNRAHLISRAVNSIISQSLKEWELVIVDDGSTDNTDKVIQKFLKDRRIKYIKKENSGAAHSRNIGFEHTKFDWITFLDSDDEALPNWLNVFKNSINSDTQVFTCGTIKYNHQNIAVAEIQPKPSKLLQGIAARFANGGNFFLKRKLFKSINGYDNELPANQNTDLVIRVMQELKFNKSVVLHSNLSLIKVHLHLGPRIRKDAIAKYNGTKKIIEKHKDYFRISGNTSLLSRYYSIVAYNAFLQNIRQDSLSYQIKAIKIFPFRLKLYLQLIRYFFKIN